MKRIFWSITLGILVISYGILLGSRKITLFLHPKLIPISFFAFVLLMVLTVREGDRDRKSIVHPSFLLFLLPVILGIFAITGESRSLAVERPREEIKISRTIEKEKVEEKKKEHSLIPMPAVAEDREAEEFISTLYDLARKGQDMLGKKVNLVGFVYKDANTEKNEFVLARLLMTCCAADATVCGYLVNYDQVDTLIQGEWVRVQGVLTLKGEDTARIEVESLTPEKAPISPYVYPMMQKKP